MIEEERPVPRLSHPSPAPGPRYSVEAGECCSRPLSAKPLLQERQEEDKKKGPSSAQTPILNLGPQNCLLGSAPFSRLLSLPPPSLRLGTLFSVSSGKEQMSNFRLFNNNLILAPQEMRADAFNPGEANGFHHQAKPGGSWLSEHCREQSSEPLLGSMGKSALID